jgi:hypothetical protein
MIVIERNIHTNEWVVFLGIFVFLLWVVAKLLNRDRFTSFLYFFVNEKYTQERIRESKWFGLVEFLMLCAGLFCLSYVVFEIAIYKSFIHEKSFFGYFSILVIICTFLILKNIVIKIVFYFFDIESLLKWYWFYKLTGFIWFSNLLFSLYLWQLSVYSSVPLVVAIGIILLLTIYVWITNKVYKKYHQLIINQFLYFILYLCALEIAPYVFAYKLMEAMKL